MHTLIHTGHGVVLPGEEKNDSPIRRGWVKETHFGRTGKYNIKLIKNVYIVNIIKQINVILAGINFREIITFNISGNYKFGHYSLHVIFWVYQAVVC